MLYLRWDYGLLFPKSFGLDAQDSASRLNPLSIFVLPYFGNRKIQTRYCCGARNLGDQVTVKAETGLYLKVSGEKLFVLFELEWPDPQRASEVPCPFS